MVQEKENRRSVQQLRWELEGLTEEKKLLREENEERQRGATIEGGGPRSKISGGGTETILAWRNGRELDDPPAHLPEVSIH